MEETDGAEGGTARDGGAGLLQGGLKSPEQDVEDVAGGPGPVVEEGFQAFGNGEHELADRHVREDVVHQMGRRARHALGVAGGAGAAALAGERDQEVMAA